MAGKVSQLNFAWTAGAVSLALAKARGRVVQLRRKLETAPPTGEPDRSGQHLLSFAAVDARKQVWEYGAPRVRPEDKPGYLIGRRNPHSWPDLS